MNTTKTMETPLWSPLADALAASNMHAFMALGNARHGLPLAGHDPLHAAS